LGIARAAVNDPEAVIFDKKKVAMVKGRGNGGVGLRTMVVAMGPQQFFRTDDD